MYIFVEPAHFPCGLWLCSAAPLFVDDHVQQEKVLATTEPQRIALNCQTYSLVAVAGVHIFS